MICRANAPLNANLNLGTQGSPQSAQGSLRHSARSSSTSSSRYLYPQTAMDDTMAVLLDAIGTMATPSPAAAVAADEFAAFMEAALDPRPAPSRLSFQPRDVIQTPASATDSPPAADSDAAPDVALTPAASSPPRPDPIAMQAAIDEITRFLTFSFPTFNFFRFLTFLFHS